MKSTHFCPIRISFKMLKAKELQDIRKRHNLTQKDLSEILEVSVRTVQEWELGRRGMRDLSDKYIRHMLVCKKDKLK
jgi:DNA-binding transcriptional regulator YiaG